MIGAGVWLGLTVLVFVGMLCVAYGLWIFFWPAVGGFLCCLFYLPLLRWFPTRIRQVLQFGLGMQVLLAVYCIAWLFAKADSSPKAENSIFAFIGSLLLIGAAITTGVMQFCEQQTLARGRLSLLKLC